MPLLGRLLLTLLLGTVTTLHAQQASASILVDSLLSAPTLGISEPTVAPDGSQIAYTIIDNVRRPRSDEWGASRTGIPWFALGSDIWVSGIGGGQARSLTGGHGNNWAPSWSPDGQRLAFLSDRLGSRSVNQAHLWVWERGRGGPRLVSQLPVMDPWGKLGRLEWLADSRKVLVKAYPAGVSPTQYAALLGAPAENERPGNEGGATVQVMQFDPRGKDPEPRTDPVNLDRLVGELALVDVQSGAVRRISGRARIGSYALSPDRRTVAWAELTGYERPGSPRILANLVACDVPGGKPRVLVRGAYLAHGFPVFPLFSWAPDSRAIAYRTNGLGLPDDVYVVRIAGGTPERIATGREQESELWAEPVLWTPDSRSLFWTRSGRLWRGSPASPSAVQLGKEHGQQIWLIPRDQGSLWSRDGKSAVAFTLDPATKHAGLATVDLTSGAIRQLYQEPKAYGFPGRLPVVTPDGASVIYSAEDTQHPPNFWVADPEHPDTRRPLTDLRHSFEGAGSGPTRLLEWRGLDGDTLRGALVYPASYRNGQQYPLIVKIYGGEDISDDLYRYGMSRSSIENLLLYTSRGYAVLLADSRTGVGAPMSDLMKSVLPGVDRAVEIGVADPARIGVIGHSYGGYSALALIVQSHRFKAAVMREGLGDLVSAYGALGDDGTNYLLSWAEAGQGQMGGSLWEVRDRFIENSPLFYLDRVQTPLLIIQGMADFDPVQSDEVFTGLRRLGKRVEYARYKGEGHFEGLWSRPNQLDYLRRVLAWFDTYLKGETP
ncbi:MAG: S9 family peptidase [Gemmatimonadales bacterium]